MLSGFKSHPISEIYVEHGIGESQYYQGRYQFLSTTSKAFYASKSTRKEERLNREMDTFIKTKANIETAKKIFQKRLRFSLGADYWGIRKHIYAKQLGPIKCKVLLAQSL